MELSRAGIGAIIKIEGDGRIGVVMHPDPKANGLGVLRVYTNAVDPEGKVLAEVGPQLIRQSAHVIMLDRIWESKAAMALVMKHFDAYCKELGI